MILDTFQKLLQRQQLDLDEIQEESHHQDMVSPVVQNLENVAISDPAYKQRRTDSAAEPRHQPAQLPSPPPMKSMSPSSVAAGVGGGRSSISKAPATDFTPLAYNPAAPAAPEPIAHREDTPPPIDAADGTGLAAAAKHDHYVSQQPPQTFGGPPSAPDVRYGQYGSPPQPPSFGPHASISPPPSFGPGATAAVQQSFGLPSTVSPLHQTSPHTSVSTSFAPPPTSAGSDNSRHPSVAAQTYVPQGQDPNSHIFGHPSIETPGTQFYQTINGQPHKALAHVQPQYPDYLAAGQPPAPTGPAAPLGGYSSYNYQQTQPVPNPPAGYDIHSQVYRPTEAEHSSHHHKPSKSSSGKPSTTEKVEKGIGKWIKKVEKNFG